ncbi:MAG: prenyltransferase/squalene oxidase repeat-containing protein, partial [Planctomycetia bacterium]
MRSTRNGLDRRRLLAALAAAPATAGSSCLGWAPESRLPVGAAPDENLVTPAVDRAAQRGLEFLARSQHPNAAFGSGQYTGNIACSALSGIAFMAGGSTPGEGPFGDNLDRLVGFMLENTSPSGFICVQRATSHGPMYDHGFGALFMAEAYGMTRRADVREKLKKAVQLIVYTQNIDGGWRYQPQRSSDADLSVTVCQMMALRAARNAGVFVPRNTVDKCIDYVRKSQNVDGGFRYMLVAGPSAFPRSAAGVVALYSAGVYEGKEIEGGLKYLLEQIPGKQSQRESHYFYGHYYAVQAMYQAGGDYWRRWYPAIREELIRRQRPDGSWPDAICAEYGTAMACIVLQLPNNF